MAARTHYFMFLVLVSAACLGCGRTVENDTTEPATQAGDLPAGIPPATAVSDTPAAKPVIYRFDENLGDANAVHVAQPTAASNLPVYDFDNEASIEGWTANAPGGKIDHAEGILTVTSEDKMVALDSPTGLGLDPFEARGLRFRMRVTGAENLRFKPKLRGANTFNPTGGENVRVVKQGEWFNYRIDSILFSGVGRTDAADHESRLINQFRFEIPPKTKVEFDYIRFSSLDEMFVDKPFGRRRHEIDYQVRPVVYSHVPSHLTFEVTVPENGRLSFGVGLVKPNQTAHFIINLEVPGGEAKNLFRESVNTPNEWRDQQIDLSEWAGSKVKLSFRIQSPHENVIGLWSNPMLYAPWEQPETGANESLAARLRQRRPNVIVYAIDALRADRLAMHGYHRDLMPNLAALAADGVNFTNAYTNDTWTKPSVATLFSGVPAEIHGIDDIGDVLPESLPLMPEAWRREIGPTLLLSENTHPGPATKMDRGFSYSDLVYLKSGNSWHHTLPDFIKYLGRDIDLPFFLYTHRMIAHDPYNPRKEIVHLLVEPGTTPSESDRYDAELILADDQLGEFVARLKTLGVFENTLLIVTADHGEAFGEHEGIMRHAGKPYNEQIHVPLVMHMPGVLPEGRTIETPVQWLDLAPTILDAHGLTIPDSYLGQSLLPLIDGKTETFKQRLIVSRNQPDYVAILGRWKLFVHEDAETPQLFDLEADPLEQRDVAAQHPEMVEQITQRLEKFRSRMATRAKAVQNAESAGRVELSTEEIDMLEALGYIE